jgi:Flp pilus assembly protein TadG
MKRYKRQHDRRGNILVLSAFFLVGMLGMVAFSLDVGYVLNAKGELQRAADAAALAGAMQLINYGAPGASLTTNIANSKSAATQYAALNKVCGSAPALSSGDILVGYMSTPTVPGTAMTFNNPNQSNAVQVTTNRTSGENGEVPLFFAKVFGNSTAPAMASATAALVTNFTGFQMPSDGSELGILPFAFDLQSWNSLMQGSGSDQWTWDPTHNTVKAGADGIPEGNLFPQGTGSPGNRGTVNIGSNNNSTAHLNSQILNGLSASDLAPYGGQLSLDGNGILMLSGNPGISAGVKSALTTVIGEPRIIPIFSGVSGQGANATYTIVEFVSVRILEVQLTGSMSSKTVTIQPTGMVAKGGIPSTSSTQTSVGIYSLPFLVR